MPMGRIKYHNSEKGFGFIAQDSGEADVFLHISAIKGVYDDVSVGQRVKYKVIEGNRGPVAQNVEVVLTPIEQKRLSQGKVVIPRDYTPLLKQSDSFSVTPSFVSPAPSQATPASSRASQKTDTSCARISTAEPITTAEPTERSPNQKPFAKPDSRPKTTSTPKAGSEPSEQPTFGDLYMQKQIRLQTPMFFALYDHVQLAATISQFARYNFVLQGEREQSELPKTDVKYCYKSEDADKVQSLLCYNEEIKAQELKPVVQRNKRFYIDTRVIQQARRDCYPIEVTMQEGEIFRGMVDWVSRYEIKMLLYNGSKVVAFRHAICDFKALPPEEQAAGQSESKDNAQTVNEETDQG